MSQPHAPVNLILPVGIQIVNRIEVKNTAGDVLCLRGSVGVIIESPTDNSHNYRIQLANGTAVSLKRLEFSFALGICASAN